MIEKSVIKKIKICHITSAHERYDIRIFHKECKSLAKNDFDVTLLVNDNLPNEIIDGVKIVSTKFKPNSRFDRIMNSKKYLLRLVKEINADIYHLHDPELLLLVKRLKKNGSKVIFDSHEHYATQIKSKDYIPKLLRNGLSFFYERFEQKIFKKIDALIFPCTMNDTNPFQKTPENLFYIDNYPKTSEFYDKFDSNAEKGHSVCYSGGLSESRGITNIIKAAYSADVKLKLAGNFITDAYRESVENMDQFSIVEYYGYLKTKEISSLYTSSNIGMCTLLNIGQYNKTDNLPTKAYEYMASGIPVIISESLYSRKILNKYKFAILVDPNNINQIKDAINFLLDNPSIATEMGSEGRRAIREKFNWEIEERKLIEMYMNLFILK